jgi:hypothetical protein
MHNCTLVNWNNKEGHGCKFFFLKNKKVVLVSTVSLKFSHGAFVVTTFADDALAGAISLGHDVTIALSLQVVEGGLFIQEYVFQGKHVVIFIFCNTQTAAMFSNGKN